MGCINDDAARLDNQFNLFNIHFLPFISQSLSGGQASFVQRQSWEGLW